MTAAAAALPVPAAVPQRGLIVLSVMAAMVMQILDMTIVNVALPSMQGSLQAAQDTVTWVLTSYIVASAIATPLTGWAADRIGRKRLFLIAVAGFTAASMLCGLSTSLNEMVAFRLVQGIFGAALAPLAQTVLFSVTPKEKFGQAMAVFGLGIMVAPIVGPSIGGFLTDNFSWRWCFYINLPVGALAFLGIWATVPKVPMRDRRFDLWGFSLLAVGIGTLQLLLDRGQNLDWFAATEVWVEIGVIVSVFWMYAVHTVTSRAPFIDMRLFKDRNFVAASVLMFALGLGLMATMMLSPVMLQSLFGYDSLTSGMVLMPRGVGTMIAMGVVGSLTNRIDSRILIGAGILLTTGSLWAMTGFSLEMGSWPVMTTGFFQGIGMGMVFVPISTVAFATLDQQLSTDGTAVFSLVRNLGSSIGISVVAAMLAANAQTSNSDLVQHITPYNPQVDDLLAGGMNGLFSLAGMVARQAHMIAFLDDFKFMEYVTLATLPLLFLLARSKPRKRGGPPAAAPME